MNLLGTWLVLSAPQDDCGQLLPGMHSIEPVVNFGRKWSTLRLFPFFPIRVLAKICYIPTGFLITVLSSECTS